MMASDMRWWRLAFKRSCRMTQTATLSSPASKTFSIIITFISIFFKETSKEENIMLSGSWKACLAKIKLICFSICTCKKQIICAFRFSKDSKTMRFVSASWFSCVGDPWSVLQKNNIDRVQDKHKIQSRTY